MKRTSPSCNNLGGGAFDNAKTFTLAAYNTSLPNANTTGVPLVLGQAGAISGVSFKALSTITTFPFDDYPTIALVNGRLIPSGPHTVPTGGQLVSDGQEVTFAASNTIDPTQGAQIYCGVASTDPAGHSTGHPFLAVNGDTDSFSLCQVGSQNNIVFKPTPGSLAYNFDSCYEVKVQMIF
ncbi:hypothetical protein C8Q80DRAFT_1111192 [Daedaleopsis nitida]|nr:hypothetical protein C8Q80DRAFT_1111192 [Daedaleopsis nitida]